MLEQTANLVAWVPLIFSFFALVISLFSLWRTYLAPFNLNITIGSPTFRLYKFEPKISGENKIWWIPSVDIPVSFVNTGAKPGKVFDIRLIFRSKAIQKVTEEFFYPKWMVQYSKFQSCDSNRFRWIDEAIESEWYPLLLLPNQIVAKHLVLESDRWDRLETRNFKIDFDIYSDYKSKWITYQTFEFYMDDWVLKELEKGCSFMLTEPHLENIRQKVLKSESSASTVSSSISQKSTTFYLYLTLQHFNDICQALKRFLMVFPFFFYVVF